MADLLVLLGIGLLKLAQTLVHLAQYYIYISTVSRHLVAKKSFFLHMAKLGFTSLNVDFEFMEKVKTYLLADNSFGTDNCQREHDS